MKSLEAALNAQLEKLGQEGRLKGKENIVESVIGPSGNKGPRYTVKGHGNKEFIRMNSNSYLGLSFRDDMIKAEEEGTAKYGVGPGAVRFISGTYTTHRKLEKALAAFHGREDAMLFSSAYMTVNGVIVSLTTSETAIVSDELNHNSIINAIKLSRPHSRYVFKHNDLADLKKCLEEASKSGAKRLLVIADGIFSMRGDHAPLKEMEEMVHGYSKSFPEDAILIIDDSHGVGAFGATGRGTEEYTGGKADVLIGTLGKAFGVNGGYVVSSRAVTTFLRENAPMYIYSNPISAGEANCLLKALEITNGEEGKKILKHLLAMTKRFEKGLIDMGYETIPGDHPVTPLVLRDTQKTKAMVAHLMENGVLATGLTFPVVPRGDEEIRFQVNADHTEADIDYVLSAIKSFKQ